MKLFAPNFNIPIQNYKNAIFTQIYGRKKIKMNVDYQIQQGIGLLAFPILSKVRLQDIILTSKRNIILPIDRLVAFVFVSISSIVKLLKILVYTKEENILTI